MGRIILGLAYIMISVSLFTDVTKNLEIIEPPSDAVAINGSDVLLNCLTSNNGGARDYLEWLEYISSTEGHRIWLSNEPPGNVSNPSKFAIEGEYNLRIKNVSVYDGGKYGCKLIVQHETPFTAEFTVFESAQCVAMGEDLLEFDMGYISCNVPYGGVTPPDIHFYDAITGEQVQIDYIRGEHYVYISANITMTQDEDGKEYECRVSLPNPPYQDMCRTALNVSYTARDITIEPEKPEYTVGEQIYCGAVGNPDPHVWWEKVQGGSVNNTINGTTLDILPTMLGANTWKCLASNVVQDNVSTIVREVVFNVVSGSTTPGDIVGSAAVTTSCLLTWFILTLIAVKMS